MDRNYVEGFVKTCQEYDWEPEQVSESITARTRDFLENLKPRDVVTGLTAGTTGIATNLGATDLLTRLYRNQELAARAGRKVSAGGVQRITQAARGRAGMPALLMALLATAGVGYGTHKALEPRRHKITIPLWRKD